MDDVDAQSTAYNSEMNVSLSKFYDKSKEYKDKKYITHDIVVNQLQLPSTDSVVVEFSA